MHKALFFNETHTPTHSFLPPLNRGSKISPPGYPALTRRATTLPPPCGGSEFGSLRSRYLGEGTADAVVKNARWAW